MAARSVRRSFASPFVVTLAAALPVAACYVQPAPARSGGSQVAQEQPQPHGNPPRPRGEEVPNQQTPDHSTSNAGVEQAPPAPHTTVANPPRPAPNPQDHRGGAMEEPAPPPKADRRWTVTRAAGKCSAYVSSACPKPVAGQPMPTCNPPPPMAYRCPPQMADNGPLAIVQLAGQRECQIEQPPINCPPNAMCNPPPPQKVACPL